MAKKEYIVPSSTIDNNYTKFVKPNTSVDDRVEPFTFEEDAFQHQYPWEFDFKNLRQDPVEICFPFHTYSIVTGRHLSTILICVKVKSRVKYICDVVTFTSGD